MLGALLALVAMAAAAPNKQVDPLWAEPTYGEWVEVEQIPPQAQAGTAVEKRTNWWDWVKTYLSSQWKQNLFFFT